MVECRWMCISVVCGHLFHWIMPWVVNWMLLQVNISTLMSMVAALIYIPRDSIQGLLPCTLTRMSAIYLPDGRWSLLCNCIYFMAKKVVQFSSIYNWSYVLLLMWGYMCHSTHTRVGGEHHKYMLSSLWQVLRQITGPLALLLELSVLMCTFLVHCICGY